MVVDVPAVTAALMGCRRQEFLRLGGFDEGYFYGLEDVDFCLTMARRLGKRVVSSNGVGATHARGSTRGARGQLIEDHLGRNSRLLHQRHGAWLRRQQARDRLRRPAYWTSMPPCIAFAVTEASEDASAGDYFTALELGRAIEARTPCQVVFLDKQRNWYDLDGVDALIVMRDDYDLGRATNRRHGLTTVAWARNWFDRWATRPWIDDYDLVWASSERGADHLSTELARPVAVMRLATDAERFRQGARQEQLASDYCFTGSFHGAPREIVYDLQPDSLPFDFAIFGHGWDRFPDLAQHLRGPVPYSRMPDVYASTRLVVDDANSATKSWGSVNSRVFDAIAAGALVVTNGEAGAAEVFGDLLPTYGNKQQLEAQLWTYLGNDIARRERVSALRAVVEAEHTYDARAAQAIQELESDGARLRVAIKIGAPSREERDRWGDYHFARSLSASLGQLGHRVRIDCLDEWYSDLAHGDDVVIVLRGLSEYSPRPGQINLLWLISHPDLVSTAEMLAYDHVFVASQSHADRLAADARLVISPMLQCTDTRVFHLDEAPGREPLGVEFIGTSRGVRRQIVDDAIAAGLDLTIYGPDWSGTVPDARLVDTYLSQADVASHYRRATVILNDHWPDMRDQGFISNRLFDAAACGAVIVSDPVVGLDRVFGDVVHTYGSRPELADVVAHATRSAEATLEARLELARLIGREHSFDARAAELSAMIERLLRRRLENLGQRVPGLDGAAAVSARIGRSAARSTDDLRIGVRGRPSPRS